MSITSLLGISTHEHRFCTSNRFPGAAIDFRSGIYPRFSLLEKCNIHVGRQCAQPRDLCVLASLAFLSLKLRDSWGWCRVVGVAASRELAWVRKAYAHKHADGSLDLRPGYCSGDG